MNDRVVIGLNDGRVTSGKWDDFEAVGNKPTERIIVADSSDQVHDMPEQWLRSRVRGWMEMSESPDMDYWIGTWTAEGQRSKWICCSSRDNQYVPMLHRVEFARRVCRAVNKHAANGGAWLAGWIRGGHEFYLLWKDEAGDIAVPLECDKPFIYIMGWSLDVWIMHCNDAITVKREIDRDTEIAKSQQVKLAQGEKMNETKHLSEAAPQIIV